VWPCQASECRMHVFGTAAISFAPHLWDDSEVFMLRLCVGYVNENDFSPIYLLAW